MDGRWPDGHSFLHAALEAMNTPNSLARPEGTLRMPEEMNPSPVPSHQQLGPQPPGTSRILGGREGLAFAFGSLWGKVAARRRDSQ